VDPDRALQGKLSEGSHPLSKNATKPFLGDATQKEVENQRNEEKGEEGIIEEVDHLVIVRAKSR
jgi:hypothetical protein